MTYANSLDTTKGPAKEDYVAATRSAKRFATRSTSKSSKVYVLN